MYRSRLKQLAFEDYFCFYGDNSANDLTTSQLKQILGVHGFERLRSANKAKIRDVVRSLDLIPPTRSTVHNDSVQFCSGEARLAPPLEELKWDIKRLEWLECSIGSVVTFQPSAPFLVNGDTTNIPIRHPKIFKVYIRRCKDKVKKEREEGEEKVKFNAKMGRRRRETENVKICKVYMRRCKDKVNEEREEGEEKVRVKFKAKANRKRRVRENVESKGTSKLWYYRCLPRSCPVRKMVTTDPNDASIHIITYTGEHNHASL